MPTAHGPKVYTHTCIRAFAAMIMFSCTSGGSGFGRGAGNVPGVMSEDDIFEYLLEEVASYERNDYVSLCTEPTVFS